MRRVGIIFLGSISKRFESLVAVGQLRMVLFTDRPKLSPETFKAFGRLYIVKEKSRQ